MAEPLCIATVYGQQVSITTTVNKTYGKYDDTDSYKYEDSGTHTFDDGGAHNYDGRDIIITVFQISEGRSAPAKTS